MGGKDKGKGESNNTALRELLDEAEISNTGLAGAIVAAAAREGLHLGTSTTTVKRMLDGSQPHWPAPRLVAAVLLLLPEPQRRRDRATPRRNSRRLPRLRCTARR